VQIRKREGSLGASELDRSGPSGAARDEGVNEIADRFEKPT
jgi:hypothetical protein